MEKKNKENQETKSWFFKKISKIELEISLGTLMRNKDINYQYQKEDITTVLLYIKRKMIQISLGP